MTDQVQAPTPVAPTVPQQSFQVPPMGDPVRPPNGNPVVAPGQTPGWLPQGQAPVAPVAPAQPVADLSSVVAMLQAALAGKPTEVPATPATPAPDANRPAWMQSSVNEFDVSSLDDPILRSMATVMQTIGKDLDLDRVMGKALSHGDITLIDEAYLRDAAGANAQQLAEIARGIVQAVEAKSAGITQAVYAEAGGEAQWDSSVAAFNTSAPHELRVTVAQMLNSTNESFIKAGAKIIAEFGKSSGLIPQTGAALLTNAAAGASGQGLNKAQFQQELAKIKPDTPGYEEARQALFTRRSLGKRVGL